MAGFRWKTPFIIFAILIAASWNGSVYSAETREFSFVTISDVHIPSYLFPISQPLDDATLMRMHNQKRLIQFVDECLALNPRPSFVMNLGDTGDAGWTSLLKLYQKLMKPLVDAGMSVYTTVGNHDLDYAGIGRQDLAEMFDPLGPSKIGRSGSRYSFDYGGCHFIVMNNRPVTGLIRFIPEDIEWLRNDLRKVKKETRVMLFMHANLPDEDTHHIVELLQPFRKAVIFHGHSHSDAITRWGNVPVVVTGSLYGGKPEAGSYRMVAVTPEKIAAKTRDFGAAGDGWGPEKPIENPPLSPRLNVIEPKEDALAAGSLRLRASTDAAARGVLEYMIPGVSKWTPMRGGKGTWEAAAQLPPAPGRHLLAFRFTADNGAVTLAHRVIRVSGGNVRVVWAKDLGSAIQGAPVIQGDRVFVPATEGGVYALRLSDGKRIWSRKAEAQIIGKMAADGNTVYYGEGRTIRACDPRTGKILWQTRLNGTVIAGITADDGRLFVPAGEHSLCCLDARGGKILWSFPVTLPIMMEPAAADGRVYFGAVDGCVRALDAATGGEIWKNQVSSFEENYTTTPFWPPVALGDKVVVSKLAAAKDEKNLIALGASDGKPAWSGQISGAPLRLVASPGKDLLYAPFSMSGKRGVQCISARDGVQRWGQGAGVGMSAGIVSGNNVYIRDDDEIRCVEAVTGTARWTYKLSTGPQGSYYGPHAFAVRDSLVIAGTMDGMVIALTGE